MCVRSATKSRTRHPSSNERASGAHDATEALSLLLLRLGATHLAACGEAAQWGHVAASPGHPANHVIMSLYVCAE